MVIIDYYYGWYKHDNQEDKHIVAKEFIVVGKLKKKSQNKYDKWTCTYLLFKEFVSQEVSNHQLFGSILWIQNVITNRENTLFFTTQMCDNKNDNWNAFAILLTPIYTVLGMRRLYYRNFPSWIMLIRLRI